MAPVIAAAVLLELWWAKRSFLYEYQGEQVAGGGRDSAGKMDWCLMLAHRTHRLLRLAAVEAGREKVVKVGHLRVVMVTWVHVKNSSGLRKNCKRRRRK